MIFGHSDKRIKTNDINRDSNFQKTVGYTILEHKKNEEIWEESKDKVDEKLKEHESNWLHATKTNDRMPKR